MKAMILWTNYVDYKTESMMAEFRTHYSVHVTINATKHWKTAAWSTDILVAFVYSLDPGESASIDI